MITLLTYLNIQYGTYSNYDNFVLFANFMYFCLPLITLLPLNPRIIILHILAISNLIIHCISRYIWGLMDQYEKHADIENPSVIIAAYMYYKNWNKESI